jgi:peptide/nickel transport system permease protein
MRVYIVKRLFMTAAVLLLVITFLSLLVQIVPGDPAKTLLGPRASPELIAKIRAQMDLDKPVHIQVGNFFWNLLHGSLGTDIFTGVPINSLVSAALPHTVILAFTSLGLAVLIGIPLGVISATHPNSWFDRISAVLSISFTTTPSFIAGLFLLLLFSVKLGALPAMGIGDEGSTSDYLQHLILPSVALAITNIGYLARLIRTSLLEVLNQPYVRAARAGGLPERLVLYKYALKNALIPTVAVLAVGLGSLMGGAVLIEIIFSRPGMGMLIFQAIKARNYPVVRGGVLVVAILFVLVNLLSDIIYTFLDPRIQLDNGGN